MSEEIELKNIDLVNDDAELCVNETFEFMTISNLAWSAGLFLACCLFVGIAIFIAPEPRFVDRRLCEANERTKELNVAIRFSDLKFYHRSITFCLESIRNRGRPMMVVVSGSVKLRFKGRTTNEVNLEERVYKLPSQEVVPIFTTGRVQMTDIVADLDVTMTEGKFKDMYLVWNLENSSWVFFSILLRAVTCVVALSIFVYLSTRIAALKDQSPAYIHKFILFFAVAFMIVWLPLSELKYFDLLVSYMPMVSLLDTVNLALMMFVVNVMCWDLVYRYSDEEFGFLKKSAFMFVIACGILALPKAIKFNDTLYQDILEVWVPAIALGITILNLLRIPLLLDRETPEFQASFLHMVICVPALALTLYLVLSRSERNCRLDMFSSAVNTITFLFLVLLHWPRDDSGYDAQYIRPDLQEAMGSPVLLSDDDNVGNAEIEDGLGLIDAQPVDVE